ncbi:transmembrane channel-like protein 5 isoform X2 [Acipenser ruthenus]|uniref:transmembrane channel-like protein 5 isoform X2 n=1 Tax=Acipenser ruthenus TaxID=7906 RepID=UPI002740405B|nr:transmembrane channel-like protein 5 isoform X2 [Acipenser ruthenus]
MSQQNRDGVLNPAYHHSETLEMDRGSPQRSQHQNPYASEDFRPRWDGGPAGRGGPEVLPPYDMERGPWDTTETIPMRPLPSEQDFGERYPSTSPQVHNGFGESSVRQRGVRKYSLFPTGTLSTSALERLGFKEDEFQDVLEEERQDLVRELAAMSSRDRVRAVRQLPMNLQEKDQIRKKVLLKKTSEKQHQEQNCCTDCSQNVSMSFRRCGASFSAVPQALQLWQGTLKEIGGKFGTSVLSYFLFLKWLLMFNIFSFLVNFGFITVPQLLDHEAKNTGTFRGLEILTGAGYFSNSVLYYGFYSNGTVSGGSASGNSTSGMPQYNMQLAYFFTIGAYLVLCCISLVYSAARSFRENFMLAGAVVGNAGRLLSSWDFSVVNEKAVRLRQDNLRTQLKESLAEKTNENLSLTLSQKLARFGIHVAAWLVSTGMAAGCCAGVYFLCCYNMNLINKSPASQSLTAEAGTLLLPVVVSLINLVIPLLYSLFKKVEPFTFPRHQIYALIIRNVLLKMSILAMLCYFWLEQVVENDNINCWETFVGQDIYRLIIIDFIFCLLGSFFGEFLHNVIGTKCLSGLGVPEFDIARNVLDLIYAQTLAWIGIFFSPLLPAIQIIKLFLIFYLKKVSLMQNCQPPKRSWRAAQMMTTFILLLFFPSFSGALSVVAFIVWRKAPSESCGPFRGLAVPYDAVSQWMDSVDIDFHGSSCAVWIYNNLIKSVLFFLIITLLVLILIYLYWQIVAGRKVLIVLLQEQISNEGKDKTFLLEKIEKLKAQISAQTAQRGGAEVSHRTGSRAFQRSRRRSQDRGSRGLERGRVSTVDQGSRSPGRGRMPEYEPRSRGRDTALPGYVQEGIGTASMLGSEREYPGRADYLQEDPYSQEDSTGPPVPSALVQALLARRQAEEEDEEEGY